MPTRADFETNANDGILSLLNRARNRSLDKAPSAGAVSNVYFSGTTYSLWRVAEPLTRKFSRGLVLDAGSGRGAWKEIIKADGATRESVDISPRANEQVTWVADLMDMPQVPANRYDATICHQVLEHVPQPDRVLSELYRTLKPGGALVLSVPHLSRQHELPHDYFRFTPGGLNHLLVESGFVVEQMMTYGGLLTFIHHQVSTALLGIAAVTRPTYLLAAAFNAPFSWLAWTVDRLVDRRGLLANGVAVVARKPAE